MTQYSINNRFSLFCKNFNLEIKNIKKINPPLHGIQQDKGNNADDIQFIWEWMKIKFGYKGCIK